MSRRMNDEPFVRVRPPHSVRESAMAEQPHDELWVRGDQGVNNLAEKIITALEDRPYIDVACIGAGTVNLAVKAIAVARKLYGGTDDDLYTQPYFSSVDDPDRENLSNGQKTRVVLRVFARRLSA